MDTQDQPACDGEWDAIISEGASGACTRVRTIRHFTLPSRRSLPMRACRAERYAPARSPCTFLREAQRSERTFALAQGLRDCRRMTIPTEPVIGVDVGASTISAGLVCPDGTVFATAQAPTRGAGPVVDTIFALIDRSLGPDRYAMAVNDALDGGQP